MRDVPLTARYGDEPSSLRVSRVAAVFPLKYARAAVKRLFYSYFLRDFNAGTLQFVVGGVVALAGVALGVGYWVHSAATDVPTTSGQVMLAALPILIGVQLLIAALNYDIGSVPREPLQRVAHANPPS